MSRLQVHTHGGVDSCPVYHPVYYEDILLLSEWTLSAHYLL